MQFALIKAAPTPLSRLYVAFLDGPFGPGEAASRLAMTDDEWLDLLAGRLTFADPRDWEVATALVSSPRARGRM